MDFGNGMIKEVETVMAICSIRSEERTYTLGTDRSHVHE